jgi:hypothetical protein
LGKVPKNLPVSNFEGCVHFYPIRQEIDRYVRMWTPKTPPSPWGLKSGPNSQFFSILSEMARLHPEDWVLQLESDVFSLRPLVPEDFSADFDNLWVLGARTHPSALHTLEDSLWNHLNGAAFYRVGSQDFIRFLRGVWQTSLLFMLHKRPDYAYDCLSSPPVWESLPPDLREKWKAARVYFASTPGMINASSLTRLEARKLVSQFTPGASPWFFHGRIE